MHDTHTGDDCRIPEDDRCVREVAVSIDDVRDLTAGLPRSYEVFVRGRIKFRVGRIV